MTAPTWRKSSKCANGTCVEIATTDQGVLMRDSKTPDRPPLTFDRDAWARFVAEARAGGWDLP